MLTSTMRVVFETTMERRRNRVFGSEDDLTLDEILERVVNWPDR